MKKLFFKALKNNKYKHSLSREWLKKEPHERKHSYSFIIGEGSDIKWYSVVFQEDKLQWDGISLAFEVSHKINGIHSSHQLSENAINLLPEEISFKFKGYLFEFLIGED